MHANALICLFGMKETENIVKKQKLFTFLLPTFNQGKG